MAQVIHNLSTRSGLRQARSAYLSEALVSAFNQIQDWAERRRTRNSLYQMPDYMLQDIGVTRAEVETEWQKPFWQA